MFVVLVVGPCSLLCLVALSVGVVVCFSGLC